MLWEADKSLFEFLTLYLNPPWLNHISEVIGDPASFKLPIIVFMLLYYWLNSPRFVRFIIYVVLLLILSEQTAQLLKHIVARPRPAIDWLVYADPHALGFPSAHALNTTAFAYFAARWFGKSFLWFLPIPLLIGLARIFANHHYPLDVVAGWFFGYTVAACFWLVLSRWRAVSAPQ
ncbi:MAG: phosphatase PAP2 family protein [Turneriella sp.]|nr:phosphatase PAP2 family protein [Turneriella sp.]